MNLPNKLTVLRLIMTPFFLLALLVEFPHHMLVALILFAAASITDYIDGNMASKLKDDEQAFIRNKKVGFIFQQYNLLSKLTVEENVEISASF